MLTLVHKQLTKYLEYMQDKYLLQSPKKNQLQLKTKISAYHSNKRALTYLLCSFGQQIPLYLQWSASKEYYFPAVHKSGL